MARISAQVSLYPLRRVSIGPPIRTTIRILGEHNLEVRIGAMSTLVWGEEDDVFAALQEAFQRASEEGDAVMTIALSNACPEGD